MMHKVIQEIDEIIQKKESYWTRLKALKPLKVSQRPGADEARELIKAFASFESRHDSVSETEWDSVKTCLVHPLFGTHQDYVSMYGTQFSTQGWTPRGMKTQPTRTPSERRDAFLARTCPEIFTETSHLSRPYGGRFYSLFGESFRDVYEDTWKDNKKSEWMELIRSFRQEYDTWKHDTAPLSPEYHAWRQTLPRIKMTLAAFQDAPKLVQKVEHSRHVSDGTDREYPYCVVNGHTITIDIEEVRDKTYSEYHHGSGELEKMLRAVSMWKDGACVKRLLSNVTLTKEGVERVIKDLSAENEQRKDERYYRAHDLEQARAELTRYIGLDYVTVQDFKADVGNIYGVYWFKGNAGTTYARSLFKHAEKTLTSFSGNWLLNLLVEQFSLEKVRVEKALKPVQMSPYFTVHQVRAYPGGYALYERRLSGELWDYCLFQAGTGETFHANSPQACVKGLREKRRQAMLAAQKKTGNVLTMDIVRKKYGFCRVGIREFCHVNSLDPDGMYLMDEVKNSIADRYDENVSRFGRELKQVGLI